MRITQTNCQMNDGIQDRCEVCVFSGYAILNTNQGGTCALIANCILSDGIKYCVKCNQGKILNPQGECEELLGPIDHCMEHSYERVDPLSYNYVYAFNFFNYYMEI